jgi:hypothetical protein
LKINPGPVREKAEVFGFQSGCPELNILDPWYSQEILRVASAIP